MKTIILWYLISVNLLSAIICAVDKLKAIRHKRRISEKSLWLLSVMGGSVGMYLTMYIVRHKTLHKKFTVGIPLLMIFQIIMLLLLTKLYYSHIMA